MNIIDKVSRKIGLMDPEEEALDKDIEALEEQKKEQEKAMRDRERDRTMDGYEHEPETAGGAHNVVNFHAAASARDSVVASYKMKVVVIEPKSFDDAQQVANCLREKRPVVINFEKTEGEAAKRIIDFISGTTYALNGEIKKVGHNVFLCAPSNVNVSYTEDEKKGTTEMPWLK